MFPAYYVFPLSTSVFSGPQINVLTGFCCIYHNLFESLYEVLHFESAKVKTDRISGIKVTFTLSCSGILQSKNSRNFSVNLRTQSMLAKLNFVTSKPRHSQSQSAVEAGNMNTRKRMQKMVNGTENLFNGKLMLAFTKHLDKVKSGCKFLLGIKLDITD
ncbi:hypothetical protein T02_6585 [Trichinella nativa]|uniref:Uncharacterized protein n=1 Tax=Trichinella nativa TaxID=6335 RepID=A0A0V1LA67_9BILA|nr:hypothetical protein T02_6585 [Trichinella nativa]